MSTYNPSRPLVWHALDLAGHIITCGQGETTLGWVVLARGAWHYFASDGLTPAGPFHTKELAKFELERSFGVMPRADL